MERKLCPGCKYTHPITEFNWKDRERAKRQVRCRSCTRAQLQSHYRRHKRYYVQKALLRNAENKRVQQQLVIEYLASHPCVDCGEADVVCLEFDHVRGRKRGDVSRMMGSYTWPTIRAEIEKCDVRCANCHRRKTAKLNGWYRVAPVKR
jgi:hypothetical protein